MDNTDNKPDNMGKFFTVSPYPHRPATPWKLEIRASFAGRKIRRFFGTALEAEVTGETLCRQIRERGTAFLDNKSLSLSAAWRKFAPRAEGKSLSHRQKVERVGRRLCEKFGATMPLEFITTAQLDAWIAGIPGTGTTKAVDFRYARMFFRWAERFDLIPRNPMKALDCPVAKPKRNILSPEEMRAVLKDKKSSEWLRVAMLLGGFAGLRSTEILRMNWEDVASGQIHVRPGVMKDSGGFSERIVDFTPPLTRRAGKLCGKTGKLVPVPDRVFHAARRDMSLRLGWPRWPENALRHSFATYHLADCKNPGLTAFQMGHTSPAMVQRVYAVPARLANAAEWWAI